ncbi:fumarate hydratase [Toxoplasma gondii GAB2-2007-GAL-DOM2]|uniref:Fumarate hydratase n=3 Tax=Toxoplasma gondii TaxID=5811 RepID=S7VVH4_TOXGG|nr:fumarate hydratase [Toxoplasma gondii GT1]KAF4644082.1 fumarate hydratase [Toxoplasma gondii]KFG38861.1 fumarate hydratase [Toxoplasma gondii GAB2-2007-GAL-DOM2]
MRGTRRFFHASCSFFVLTSTLQLDSFPSSSEPKRKDHSPQSLCLPACFQVQLLPSVAISRGPSAALSLFTAFFRQDPSKFKKSKLRQPLSAFEGAVFLPEFFFALFSAGSALLSESSARGAVAISSPLSFLRVPMFSAPLRVRLLCPALPLRRKHQVVSPLFAMSRLPFSSLSPRSPPSSCSSLSPLSPPCASSGPCAGACGACNLQAAQRKPENSRSLSSTAAAGPPVFAYKKVLNCDRPVDQKFKRLNDLSEMVKTVQVPGFENPFLRVPPELLTALTKYAFEEISFFLRRSHLESLRRIYDDPDASDNDRFVALTLLKNANIAAGRVFPGCQDTGTAIVLGKKGASVLTDGSDEEAISKGVFEAYTQNNLRYSQVAPRDMFTEYNTRSNLPADITLLSTSGNAFELLFVAKGGGSANKTFLYQQTKALLNPTSLFAFLEQNIKTIGTSACPPYHLAIVVGGLSAEQTLKTVKLASCHYLDGLPTSGGGSSFGFRDLAWEEKILQMTREIGIGAQFGGKYFCHDVRVIRLPRHGASCPVGIGVSCSADRQLVARIQADGVFVEELEENPAQFLPDVLEDHLKTEGEDGREAVKVDLNKPMKEILAQLSQYGTATRLSLSGTMIVARDIAHAKLLERLEKEGDVPEYLKNHPIYYAGPAKTPEGEVSGSFGPTTAGRMDVYVDKFMQKGGSMITLAKGNRSKAVAHACKKYGGFYLGSIGGPAAVLGRDCIKKVDIIEYPELGMEAVWKIEVEDFPAFIVIDDKGHDFYSKWIG